jgi:hypothetical protein
VKVFLDHFAAIVGSLTVVLLLMSISHEYGYFLLMGQEFQTLLTPTDYLANGVLWLPVALATAYGAIDWNKLKEVPKAEKRDWKNWRTYIWPIFLAVFVIFSFLTMTWPPNIFSIYFLGGVFVFIWSRTWPGLCSSLPQSLEELALIQRQIVRIGPPLLFILFLLGAISAVQDLESPSDPYTVRFKTSDQNDTRIFLRSFDKGILVRNPQTQKVEFQKWDNVVTLEKQPHKQTSTLMCGLFEICPKAKTAPKDD